MIIQNKTEESVGIDQKTQVKFGNVWKVFDQSKLITTSGRLHTTTLDDTITQVLIGWPNRVNDYSVFFNETIVAIIHPDDTFELEP